jgi:hypothetical protein
MTAAMERMNSGTDPCTMAWRPPEEGARSGTYISDFKRQWEFWLHTGGGSPQSILRQGSAPGRSHRAGWLWPLHHHHEHPALIPTANPADAPTIDAIHNGDLSEEPQKLGLNLHADPSLRGSAVKAACDQFPFSTAIGLRVRPGTIWQGASF